MATSSAPPSQATLDLVNQITELGAGLKNGSPGAREDVLAAASRLVSELSTPTENALQLLWAQPTHLSVVRMGIEIGLFSAMLSTPPSGETSTTIASRCLPAGTVDPILVARMLRHLAAMSTVRETAVDTFAPTPTSLAFAEPGYQDTILYIVDDYQRALDATPSYFRTNNFQAPTSNTDAPFQHAFQCKGTHYFEYFAQHAPEMGRRFASMMDVWSIGRQRWFDADYYPVSERLITGAEEGKEAVFLVDVGGGTGHDVRGLRKAFGDKVPGKLVLQDRPETIEIAEVDAGDEKMAHDFLTEQPIKGARTYLLHSIIQDWSTPVATQILSSLLPALKKGYSRLLINDFVVPNANAHWSQTALDWELMVALGARHRTLAEFGSLCESVGLRVCGVWRGRGGGDAVLEVEVA